jgi:diacylglycerol O-acyltransferase
MAQPVRRMTALDAAFWHLERRGQLLHVGGVYPVAGALDFGRLLDDVGARLHLIPRYTERVVPVPLNLAQPTWEPDPAFDLRNHLFRHRLRPPGDDAQLVQLASRLFAQPLDRTRPLWELHQIDGYRGDRSALFTKVHHAMIDGVSGVQLLGVIFDAAPNPPPPPARPTPHAVRELPTPLVQLARAVADGVRSGAAVVRAVADAVRDPRRALAEASGLADALAALAQLVLTSPPRTPFNGFVSTLRRVLWVTFPLNEVKAVKNRLGGTVNDVILATISAALRRYLEAHDENPDRTELRAMLPVNVRRADEHLQLGNRVSALIAPLPVGIYDPLERLRQVRAATAQLKAGGQAAQMSRTIELLALLPPFLQPPLGWLQAVASPINTVCTNVPGPPVSLYAQGQRLETLVPIVPIMQGVGLSFAILSYADTITIGITVDPALVSDAELLPGFLTDGYAELRALAAVEMPVRLGPIAPERQRRRTAPSQVA